MKRFVQVGFLLFVMSGLARAELKSVFKKENLQLLVEGFSFVEGPTWDGKENILFTSPKTKQVIRYSLKDGRHSVFSETDEPFSALYLREGKLYATRGELKSVVRIEAPDLFVTLAGKYKNAPFNKPNDLWVSPGGHIYFTDPNYGRKPLSQDGEFAYHISKKGTVHRIGAQFKRPNGIVGSEDGKTLFITDAGDSKTYRFPLNDDGSVGKGVLFTEIGGDGMTLDRHGNLYISVPRQKALVVISPKGKEIARISEFGCTNLCFGPEGRVLYITGKPGLWSLKIFKK